MSNDLTSNKVEPIPVVLLPPTLIFKSNPIPVSVVVPKPTLETPTTGKFSYVGEGGIIFGFI